MCTGREVGNKWYQCKSTPAPSIILPQLFHHHERSKSSLVQRAVASYHGYFWWLLSNLRRTGLFSSCAGRSRNPERNKQPHSEYVKLTSICYMCRDGIIMIEMATCNIPPTPPSPKKREIEYKQLALYSTGRNENRAKDRQTKGPPTHRPDGKTHKEPKGID